MGMGMGILGMGFSRLGYWVVNVQANFGIIYCSGLLLSDEYP
jgi:hypothetical protein